MKKTRKNILTYYKKCGIIVKQTKKHIPRGISAVGSARHWQCRGHGFESRMLHNEKRHLYGVFFRYAHFIYGTRSSVKKTVRWTVFSGDRRFLQGTHFKICTHALQKPRRVPYAHFIYGTRSSVKKTVRWTVFSGDRRILRST